MEDLMSEAQKPKITCYTCRQPCAGEVLRVQDKHFHITCFVCRVCRRQLATDGFFVKDGMYYCTRDYQEMFGTKCHGCGDYVEGEVVTALGKTYHQKCFVCSRCRQPFPPGDRVTFNGRDCLCKFCITPNAGPNRGMPASTACAGCGDEIKSGQALLALDKQWHLWCFKCTQCGCMLAGEYMGKEGRPYCERDYQQLFGVKCAGCLTYITGKVLQLSVEAVLQDDGSFSEAGEKHYHPHCAKCAKCGLMFGEGEEMYLQDNQIWHPDCSKAAHANGVKDQYWRHQDYRVPKQNYYPIKQIAEKLGNKSPPYRAKYPKSSPRCPQYILQTPPKSPLKLRRQVPTAPMLKQKNSPAPKNRMYMGSYLNKPQGMQRASGDPKDPKQKHFHTPESAFSYRYRPRVIERDTLSFPTVVYSQSAYFDESEDKKKTAKLDDDIVQATRYPSGFRPQPDFPSRIERDDWPGPPSPAATGRLRRSTSPLEDLDRRREQEHKKVVEECQSGLGKMILKDMKPADIGDMDPRSASRVPAADHEPPFKPRYDSPVDASPSRTYVSPMEENADMSPRQPNYAPPGGYLEAQKKASTLPSASRPGMRGADHGSSPDLPDFEATYTSTTFISLQKKPHTTENGLTNGLSGPYWDNEAPGALHSKSSESSLDRSSAYSSSPVRSREVSGSDLGSLQRSKGQSLPDMGPPKIYPVVELLTTNYKLPPDVDRSKLENHMSDADFDAVFHMSRDEFSRLAAWRRTELKKRAHLF
ncbi:actin-binding LIM protein 1-like isoform X36 [Branchiostoma floridae]|uniref:Actin-binding LIM protein 1-like isoform X36 n=1 Tax=Branchiostoma floridae TaxID=7739 RepID=A0A9J7MPT0_BRAFL|nr:actin-binding LIM protein 1-like isoform X36 [Branchiostoma floridae]